MISILSIKLTIYTWSNFISFLGKTNDLNLVVNDIYSKNKKKMVGIGFSLGGQLLMKYLGESKEHQEKFSVAASICQGYDLEEYVDRIIDLFFKISLKYICKIVLQK